MESAGKMLAHVWLGAAALEIDFSVSLAPVSAGVLLAFEFSSGLQSRGRSLTGVPVQSGKPQRLPFMIQD